MKLFILAIIWSATINAIADTLESVEPNADFSHTTSLDTYDALYGRDGTNIQKCAEGEAFALLGKLDSQQQH